MAGGSTEQRRHAALQSRPTLLCLPSRPLIGGRKEKKEGEKKEHDGEEEYGKVGKPVLVAGLYPRPAGTHSSSIAIAMYLSFLLSSMAFSSSIPRSIACVLMWDSMRLAALSSISLRACLEAASWRESALSMLAFREASNSALSLSMLALISAITSLACAWAFSASAKRLVASLNLAMASSISPWISFSRVAIDSLRRGPSR